MSKLSLFDTLNSHLLPNRIMAEEIVIAAQ